MAQDGDSMAVAGGGVGGGNKMCSGVYRHSGHMPRASRSECGESPFNSGTPHRPSAHASQQREILRPSYKDYCTTGTSSLDIHTTPSTHYPWKAVPAFVVSARPPAANPVPKRRLVTTSMANHDWTGLLSQSRQYLSALPGHRKRRIATRASQGHPYRPYR
jgi:hypothetical protein